MTARHRAFVEGDRVDWVPTPGARAGHGTVVDVTGFLVTIENHRGHRATYADANLRLSAPLPDYYAPAIDPFWVTV